MASSPVLVRELGLEQGSEQSIAIFPNITDTLPTLEHRLINARDSALERGCFHLVSEEGLRLSIGCSELRIIPDPLLNDPQSLDTGLLERLHARMCLDELFEEDVLSLYYRLLIRGRKRLE